MLSTSREVDGYDGKRGTLKWWFEAWGSGASNEWTTREDAGRPPRPEELATADYVVFGFQKRRGHVFYRTRVGGLDLRKKRKRKSGNRGNTSNRT